MVYKEISFCGRFINFETDDLCTSHNFNKFIMYLKMWCTDNKLFSTNLIMWCKHIQTILMQQL